MTGIVGLMLAGFLFQQISVEGEFGPAAIVGVVLLSAVFLVLALMSYLAGTRHRETVRNWLISFTVAVAFYLFLDIVAGQVLIEPLSPPLVPNEYRHHALVPNSNAELRQRDFQYIQRVNSLGLRGREISAEKPAGTRRVLFLGDSFTMGKGVEENETFAVLVEELLQDTLAACDGEKVEGLNGGVDSYTPLLSYLQFERELAALSPDLVILNLDNSDLIQEQAYRKQAIRSDDGSIVSVPQVAQDSLYERFLSWTTRNMYFTRIALVYTIRAMDHREVSVRRVVNEFGREHFAHTLEGDVDRTSQWQDIFHSIERIDRLSQSIDAGFLLVTYPWAHQVNDTDWVPGRYMFMEEGEKTSDLTEQTIRRHAAKLGIDLFEALPAFQAYRGAEPLYFKFDPHWTPTGHKIMAGGLAGYLAEREVRQWCN